MLKKIAQIQIKSYENPKNKKDIIESLENAGYTVVLDYMTTTDEYYIISLDDDISDNTVNKIMFRNLNVGDIFSYKDELYIRVDIDRVCYDVSNIEKSNNAYILTAYKNCNSIESINAINLSSGSFTHIDLDTMVSKRKNIYKS